ALRAALEQRLSGVLQGPEGQLAGGLLLGRDVNLSPALRADLQATGTSHILAVSGFNVALVGGAALGLGGRVLERRWAIVLAVALVAVYTLLVGAPASAVRAGLMFGVTCLAMGVGRLPDPITSLVLAAAVMGAFDPGVLLDLGFQLSFASTLGLIVLGKHLTPSWRRLPRGLAAAFAPTLAAQ